MTTTTSPDNEQDALAHPDHVDLDGDSAGEYAFMAGCPVTRRALPCPELPLVVTIDGGYVRSSQQSRASSAGPN